MKKLILLVTFLYTLILTAQTSNFHDTQGKLEISSSGQANYILPIAMPPSLKNTGPVINIIYQSGNFGGIAGQGWHINSISTISRIATRKDLDGFQDGVDFDDNDKLALDGQRLLLVSGQYWGDGSVYQTETQSNTKIELKGTGTGIYFIVTAPDGSRSWYGNYSGNDATDLTAYYITRFEDTTGNYITYHYTKPFNKSLCISEIKFSANTNGLTPLNSILFLYKQAQRAESTYIKGVKFEKAAILDNIQVKSNDALFRKYVFTHIVDPKLGYEKIAQIQEFNAALEPANPVLFEYDNTQMLSFGSEVLTTYQNNLNFGDVLLNGDFDGDGRMDFATQNQLFVKTFLGTIGQPPTNLPIMINSEDTFTATTLSNNKLNQFHSIVKFVPSEGFKVYNYQNGSLNLSYAKNFSLPTHLVCFNPVMPCESIKNAFLEGDFNGDGISEVIMYKKCTVGTGTIFEITSECDQFYWIDLNPNVTSTITGDPMSAQPAPGATILTNADLIKGTKHVGDFNGDGKSDIMVINPDKTYKVVSLKQLNAAPWMELELIGSGTLDQYSANKQILFGDYNGDGKTDIMIPNSDGSYPGSTWWTVYFSNPKPAGGSFFESETYNIVDYWNNSGNHFSTGMQYSSYYALDTNGDGKSDLVRVWRNHYKPNGTIDDYNTNWKITSFANVIGKTSGSGFVTDYITPCQNNDNSCDHDSDSPDMVIPIVSTYRDGVNKEILILRNHHNQVTYVDFTKDVAKDILLKKVTAASGAIVDEITYQTLIPSDNNNGYGNLNEFYSSTNSLTYPYVEIKKLPLTRIVSKLTNKALGTTRYQDFKYHGYSVNMEGIGALGFIKTARSSWYRTAADKKMWNVVHNDPTKRNAMVSSYSILEATGTPFSFTLGNTIPAGAISSIANEYSIITTNGLYIPLVAKQTTLDNLTSVKTEKTYTYQTTYNLPETITTKNFLGTTEQGKITSVTEYENNPSGTGANYYIGRPKKFTITTQAYNDSHSVEELFTYNTNGTLAKSQKKPIGESYYLTEDFEYDIYGNVKKKTLSAPGAPIPQAPRINEFSYDPTARFVLQSKDISDQITTYTYDPLYGQVLTQTNHYNQTTITTYDNWGKPKKVTDYLGKNMDYSYTKENGEYTTRITKDDGAASLSVANSLGQEIKKGIKLINNQWSYTGTQYDYLGRKIRDNDVYVDIPLQWTSYTYDDYGRLIQTKLPTDKTTDITYNGLTVTTNDGIKVTTATKNANGHIITTTDNGGTINYKYDAIGNLKESDFEGSKIITEYNKWGKKIRLQDPSAGEYKYTYYPFGEISKETTPKGNAVKSLDDYGRIALAEDIEPNGKSYYTQYYYNSDYTFFGSIREELLTGNVVNEEYYEYDSYKRPNKITQITPNATFVKELTYDAFGRIFKEKQTATVSASGKSSSKTFRYTYKYGYKHIISDDLTNQDLWLASDVNIRGQLTNGTFGNGLILKNVYNSYGHIEMADIQKLVPNPNYGQGPLEPIEIQQSKFKLLTTFYAKTENLISRQNTLFNHSETFQYDTLDRLVKWDKEILTIHDNKFNQGFEEFVSKSNAVLTNQNGTLKVTATPLLAGVKKTIVSQAKIGDKLNFKVFVNKGTTNKVSVYIREYNPVNGQSIQSFKAFAGNGEIQFEHTVTQYPVIELHIEKVRGDFELAEEFPTDFYVDNLLVERYIIEQQNYDNRGRIIQNTLGQYNYGDTTKAYQNTSIDLTPEARAYYQNREGIFNDGMEEQKGWSDLGLGWDIFTKPVYDDSKSKTGKYSLKLHNPTSSLKSTHTDKWIPIKNTTTTQYTYSGWVYSDGPDAQVQFFMKKEGETGYSTYVDNYFVGTKNQWVYIEKIFNVPADVTKLNIRLDNNGGGNVWFDDIRIKKTANPATALRKLNIDYDMFKKPTAITETGVTKVDFIYNENHFRNTMYYGGLEAIGQRPYRKDYSSDGAVEITTNQLTGESTFVFFVGGDAYSAPAVFKDSGTVKEYLYLHRDHQGSILAISNQAGNFVEKRLFDPWGNLLKIQDGQGNNLDGLTVLDRGYTGHEHIQSIGIINMNGRLYDAKLHRFLSPDNYVQDPHNTQNYNRYGYVLNNPLKFTDPSGEIIAELGVAVLIGAAIAATTYTLTAMYTTTPFTVGGLIQSTAIGAFSAAVTFGIGELATNIAQLGVRISFQSVAHGAFQGTMSGVQGGNFFSGFAAGAISSVVSSLYGGSGYKNDAGKFVSQTRGLNGLIGGGSFGMIAFGTVSGGAGAALTGGNFWQGATTGLIVSGLNHAMHSIDDSDSGDPKPKIKPIPKTLKEKIDRLREGFDFLEDYGGYTEIAGLILAPFTEGASLGVIPVGMAFTFVGTAGNIILDYVEYKQSNNPAKLDSAKNRAIKYGLTLGHGKVLEKLALNFTDKLITKFLDIVIDKGIYTTVLPTTK